MRRKSLFIGGILLLLITAAATPFSARAEGDLPPKPEPVKPFWITRVNPEPKISSDDIEELSASGLIESWQGVEVPLLAALAATGISEAGAVLAPALPVITSALNSAWNSLSSVLDYIQSGLGPLLNPGIVP